MASPPPVVNSLRFPQTPSALFPGIRDWLREKSCHSNILNRPNPTLMESFLCFDEAENPEEAELHVP
ncbi:hypothetical protein JMJ77_0010953 [Colletotrichum scovillei]|uniref:Uncharacterized protein n=1 Tax=Colletotrichum scovillei TaxID=1209932 RepID=A0A9P7UGB3_9PEZI|nr:hypothetical protein JMJ77_0010953 [Colletotrichum scovillei]KAG7059956.1 hypothetical protein JMJ78_0015240 [Colletotrichum scovillei]KAG7067371.1 hypothetical protein JMJ76_0008810 [Colletotrichum scovillei]